MIGGNGDDSLGIGEQGDWPSTCWTAGLATAGLAGRSDHGGHVGQRRLASARRREVTGNLGPVRRITAASARMDGSSVTGSFITSALRERRISAAAAALPATCTGPRERHNTGTRSRAALGNTQIWAGSGNDKVTADSGAATKNLDILGDGTNAVSFGGAVITGTASGAETRRQFHEQRTRLRLW